MRVPGVVVSSSRLRQVVRLVHEAHEIGPRSQASRQHFVDGVRTLLGAPAGGFLVDPSFVDTPETTVSPVDQLPTDLVKSGFEPATERIIAAIGERRTSHPVLQALIPQIALARAGEIRSCLRSDVVSDSDWSSSPFVVDQLHVAGYDDWLCSFRVSGEPGLVSGLGMIRARGDRPFSEEDRDLLELLFAECGSLLDPPEGVVLASRRNRLAPRVRETLDLLLTGATDKEIAERLCVGAATVRQHVAQIYRAFGVSGRAGLVSLWFDDAEAPRGVASASLTRREREVLEYLALGYTNDQIAVACGKAANTVKRQVASLFRKLDVSTRAEAARVAVLEGYIEARASHRR